MSQHEFDQNTIILNPNTQKSVEFVSGSRVVSNFSRSRYSTGIQSHDLPFFFSLFRVKKLTKMSEKVATGVLSGVVKVSGFFTSSIVNSKVGKKFFSLLPGEIVLASLDGFSKLFI